MEKEKKKAVDKRKSQFIKLFRGSIAETVIRMRNAGLDISYRTGKRYYNDLEIYEQVEGKVSIVNKERYQRKLSSFVLHHDNPKIVLEAGRDLSKVSGWNEPEKIELSASNSFVEAILSARKRVTPT